MKTLNLSFVVIFTLSFYYSKAQNHEGEVNELQYQEASGRCCIAKLGEIINRQSHEGRYQRVHGSGDITWLVQKRGDTSWSKPTVWLTYLETDPGGDIWRTKVQISIGGNRSISTFSYIVTSKNRNGEDEGSSFQIIDWYGKRWNVEIRGDISPVIVLSKISN